MKLSNRCKLFTTQVYARTLALTREELVSFCNDLQKTIDGESTYLKIIMRGFNAKVGQGNREGVMGNLDMVKGKNEAKSLST